MIFFLQHVLNVDSNTMEQVCNPQSIHLMEDPKIVKICAKKPMVAIFLRGEVIKPQLEEHAYSKKERALQ